MQYTTTHVFESKIVEGLKYTLKKFSHGRRVKLNEQLAPSIAKIVELERERTPLLEEVERAADQAKIAPCTCTHDLPEEDCHTPDTNRCTVPKCDCRKPEPEGNTYERINEVNQRQLEVTINELYPIYVRWGVKEIDGLDIDGVPATPDSLVDLAPEGLMKEVVDEIMRLSRMSTEEQLAFKSPTTSVAQVDGQTPDMSAPIASA